ncbi:bifunctional methylenetetrahydrofolate dehydrogenase/cyclohydrolase, mitochondrial [Nilaparvata lugens]|uniref:bifunctional methylenetetrahydrofolate dehydrogenase/cyclohydrolase, mitochondrial n=1 Tax=Nilaparvata lugens TaxID=108931 RepID=UPI00193E7894|nr:bifunctional methylenetetrahydrofolate dehydrogenase/cyclohydrolase, mitochondrial [Nilaparvata lugens]
MAYRTCFTKFTSQLKSFGISRNFSTSFIRNRAKLIDGKSIADEIQLELKNELKEWTMKGNCTPRLTAILVGDDPASKTYVKNKMRAAKTVGIETEVTNVPNSISEKELMNHIEDLNSKEDVHGILIQLPLPSHIEERKVCNAVSPSKDVDGFHIFNVGQFCLDMDAVVPCTPLAVQELIKRTGIDTVGKNAVVCGRSKNVGLPIAMLLHADGKGETNAMDATTTICHRNTPPDQLATFTRLADIIVTATGIPNLIKADMVKKGACVIDVGITRVLDKESGKHILVGDVDFEGVKEVAGYITPVPGGVGPMTVAMLMKNTLKAAKRHSLQKAN